MRDLARHWLRFLEEELPTAPDTDGMRRIRRVVSKELKLAPAAVIYEMAEELVGGPLPGGRFVACELVAAHEGAMKTVTAARVRQLAHGMSGWVDTDVIGCYVSGPAWRMGQISDKAIDAWASSRDRWWRRTALVSTVPLNSRARGGNGDVQRTLAVCAQLMDDRDPMVYKAVSWALRELAKREPAAVKEFIAANGGRLHSSVVREVRSKLETGLKAGRRRNKPRSTIDK
jgi:3-methyladenine DNA glycosylase AlkD